MIDNWFSLQAMLPGSTALSVTRQLTKHPLFSMKNPNKVRALLFAFTNNMGNFHRADGKGYDFIANKVLELDRVNPQIAARLLAAFRSWRTLEPVRRQLAQAALSRVVADRTLSPDVTEIATKTLA